MRVAVLYLTGKLPTKRIYVKKHERPASRVKECKMK